MVIKVTFVEAHSILQPQIRLHGHQEAGPWTKREEMGKEG